MAGKKVLAVLMAATFIFCSLYTPGANRADAAVTVTVSQLASTANILAKLRNISRDQALQAVNNIAPALVNKLGAGDSWLTAQEMNKLASIGLTKDDVNLALNQVRAAVNDDSRWAGLTSQDLSTQLSHASNLATLVINSFSSQFIDNLKGQGLKIEDLISLALDLSNIRISSWDDLINEVITRTFANSAIQSKIGQQKAASYGFKAENMTKALNSLTTEQKEEFRQILIKLGIWVVTSGGGGSATHTHIYISEQDLDTAIKASENTGIIGLKSDSLELALSVEQINSIAATGKPLEVKIGGVIFHLDAKALKGPGLDLNNAGHITLTTQKVSASKAKELSASAASGGLYRVAGDIYKLGVKALMKNGTEQAVGQLNGVVKVSLPVPEGDRKAAQDGYLAVERFNESTGTWDEVPGGVYDENSGSFLFETSRLSYWALMEKKIKTFSDITGHWAQKDIEYMATHGYIAGMGGGIFKPDRAVTRAQFAAMLANVLKLTGQGDIPFKDVPSGEWYKNFVARAYTAGVVKGYSTDRFAPDDLITREQMAAMISNALRPKELLAGVKDPENTLAIFADQSSISGWARVPAAQAVQHGLLKGRLLDNTLIFAPQDHATRAEAAVMLKKLLALMK